MKKKQIKKLISAYARDWNDVNDRLGVIKNNQLSLFRRLDLLNEKLDKILLYCEAKQEENRDVTVDNKSPIDYEVDFNEVISDLLRSERKLPDQR